MIVNVGSEADSCPEMGSLVFPPILPPALGPVLFGLYILFQREINFFLSTIWARLTCLEAHLCFMELRWGIGSRTEGIVYDQYDSMWHPSLPHPNQTHT